MKLSDVRIVQFTFGLDLIVPNSTTASKALETENPAIPPKEMVKLRPKELDL